MKNITIKRALISVSDKANLVPFAQGLAELGVEILSTGGTAKLLAENGIDVVKVDDYTGFPEIMGGRVKTLHPKIHGGLLGRLNVDDDVMAEHGIGAIDMLVVNLYPFAATIAKPNCRYEDAVENIDIGGPAMLRAGAKNHERVAVVTDPGDYQELLRGLKSQSGALGIKDRKRLAAKVYAHTAQYDAQIANYLIEQQGEEADVLIQSYRKKATLRYGENPHQSAAVYTSLNANEYGVANAQLLQGKALSYNNLADADAAVAAVYEYDELACVIVKHANPCGIAEGDTLLEAYDRAHACDPTSAFGGIIAFNRPLDKLTAEEIIKRQFVEVIIAPVISSEALPVLATKKNVRLLSLGENYQPPRGVQMLHRISGGLLVQSADEWLFGEEDFEVVTEREPTAAELHDLLFAWKAVKHVKSNAIVFVKDKMTLGIGCGQTSRVHSSLIGSIKAGEQGLDLTGSALASDAFFPFRDGLDNAAKHGATAVIQPGGSMRDDEVIAAANEHGIAMIFTGVRHFKH
ncbi:MAG: bifunctional phosphoribosylaminoimidazolecarboxamide formyltransferase/inosine monophosphate cyclohydrolase [Gammaproteobacteria bacterium]|nr:MAG: bifunctional phosphoribosylaminoimidazolecarboxamide formyltransferase/inosine monophosphate cyclohydrolase [Gammaproteobacteria bacterium]